MIKSLLKNSIVLVSLFNILFSQIDYNMKFRINEQTDGIQSNIKSTMLNNGNYVVTWESNNGQDGDKNGIISQLFDSNCMKIGHEIIVNCHSKNDQYGQKILSLNDDKFVVCWQSEYQDGSYSGIYAQIFNNNVDRVGSEFRANDFVKGHQLSFVLYPLTDNSFVICWQDGIRCSDYEYNDTRDGWLGGIYAKIYNSNGDVLVDEFQVNDDYKFDDISPKIHRITGDIFLFTWLRQGNGTNGYEIFGKLYHQNGKNFGNEFQINSYISNLQTDPQVLGNNKGEFIVVWQSDKSSVNQGSQICGQIFNSVGDKIGNEFNLSIYTYGCYDPKLLKIDDDHFYIIWNHGTWCIKAQKMSTNWEMIDDDIILIKRGDLYWVNNQVIIKIGYNKFMLLVKKGGSNTLYLYGQMLDENFDKIGEEFIINEIFDPFLHSIDLLSLDENKFVVIYELYYRSYPYNSNLYAKYYLNSPLQHDLEEFQLVSPKFDEVVKTPLPIFKWEKSCSERVNLPWEFYYDLYISKTENFENPIIYNDIVDASFQIKDTLD